MSKRKLTDEEKEARREERRTLRQRAKDRSQNLQDWLTKRKEAAQERAKEARQARNSRPRGVDRVPESMRNLGGHTYTPIVEYDGGTRRERRAVALSRRERPERIPRDTIFHKKDHKGNLTSEKVEVKPTRMPARKVEMPRSGNAPYQKPRG